MKVRVSRGRVVFFISEQYVKTTDVVIISVFFGGLVLIRARGKMILKPHWRLNIVRQGHLVR